MKTRMIDEDFESYEDDLKDIQDILDDPTLDEAEKLDAIAELVMSEDGDESED